MQHASQQTPAKDPRYPLTGSIVEHDIRQVTTDGSSYVVLTLDRGQGKDPVKAVAFDDKFDQVMDLIDKNVHPVRLFGFFEKREFADADTGEIKTSRRFRVLWAGEPRQEEPKKPGRAQTTRHGQQRPRNGQSQPQNGGQQRQGNNGGQRQQSGGQNRPRNGNGQSQRQSEGAWWPN